MKKINKKETPKPLKEQIIDFINENESKVWLLSQEKGYFLVGIQKELMIEIPNKNLFSSGFTQKKKPFSVVYCLRYSPYAPKEQINQIATKRNCEIIFVRSMDDIAVLL